jgi:hypothetical protein
LAAVGFLERRNKKNEEKRKTENDDTKATGGSESAFDTIKRPTNDRKQPKYTARVVNASAMHSVGSP